ncbi:hypothetical protein MATL_G00043830 [Megalops atlanticus]|uniref:Uncharacterized protein n=1 Tax=Megalops atlanticus TaxID=7932 RepID=A0A9D3QCV5_MEGAT|nr:hypothetical protein MATL_G00043830 [Megalops atlanticus]
MLVTMMTVMYVLVKTAEQLAMSWWSHPETLPYMVSPPLPWQVQCVSQNRRGSRVDEPDGKSEWSENGGPKHQSNGDLAPDKAAATIQNQYRKYQQKKQREQK